MKTCINCGYETDTPHCPNCGQKMEVKRVSLRSMFEEFISKWIGFDNQFGRTVIDMAVRPNKVIHSYLGGNRVRYLGPLGYVVIMTALLIISFDLFGLEVQDFLKKNQDFFNEAYGIEKNPQQAKIEEVFMKPLSEFLTRNYRFVSAALIPFWAIAMALFYRERKLNYVERLVVATYTACEAMWLTILSLAILATTGYLASVPILIISFIYYSFALHKTFPEKEIFESIVKAFFSILIGFLLFMIVISILIAIYFILIVIRNPELFQQQG